MERPARLPAVRLKPDHYENQDGTRHSTMPLNAGYCILGEWGDSDHYIVLCVDTGQVIPGAVHLDRFEEIPEEDL
jgi:hypothetical protein